MKVTSPKKSVRASRAKKQIASVSLPVQSGRGLVTVSGNTVTSETFTPIRNALPKVERVSLNFSRPIGRDGEMIAFAVDTWKATGTLPSVVDYQQAFSLPSPNSVTQWRNRMIDSGHLVNVGGSRARSYVPAVVWRELAKVTVKFD
jgi:hypothetical protein